MKYTLKFRLYYVTFFTEGNTAAGATGGPARSSSNTKHLPFLVGERVRVIVTVEQLKSMQGGHGGWNHKMAEVWNDNKIKSYLF